MEPPPRPSAFSRALSKVLADGQFKASEIAEVAGCSDRQIRKVANQRAALGHDKAEKVARWLCRHSETRPTGAFLCAAYQIQKSRPGEITGTVDDDLSEIMRHLGHLKDHQDELDQEKGRRAIRKIRKEIRDLEAEVENWEQ